MKPVLRVFAAVLPLALAASPALAQRSDQLELGGYASFTRFDRAFALGNKFGGGARLGYFLTNRVSLEIEGNYAGTTNITSAQPATMQVAAASLVLNYGSGRNMFYILGGYSRLVFGKDPPYHFIDNGLHGGVGDRIFLSDKLALRLEGRAIWSPKTNFPTGTWGGQVIGTAGLSYFLSQPQQRSGRPATQYQWYWGAQGGAFVSKTNKMGYTYDPIVGGHWLITARRTALYVAYEQAIFLGDDQASIADPGSSSGLRDVTFHDMRRVMAGLMAFPLQRVVEPFVGGGFALMEVLNPVVDCSGTTPNSDCTTLATATAADDLAHKASSKAFFWFAGGLQMNYGKMTLYGQWTMTSAAQGFLLDGNTHTLQGGIRYSFGTSKEGVTERQ
jgi:hypothetical protein